MGRCSSQSSASIASSTDSCTDADGDGSRDDEPSLSLRGPLTTTEEAAGAELLADAVIRCVKTADSNAACPADGHAVDAALASGGEGSADDMNRTAEAANRGSMWSAAAYDVDAVLAAGGDARVDTGVPLDAEQEGRQHRTAVGVLSMPETGEGDTTPGVGTSQPQVEGALP